ncbi:hypothetical protein HPP92_028824 [Vanilla planifolia]|uniref:Uncharacterized protein n=1 Tax=Vanilla planifolia TaxID=51239 RepID=A0A835U311_VANPL|nr:hypothetical protein HPP92_028824 [Vanilla planifolia]KAG0446496.1 hypothetical protein HPP92_028813 [Vanilla planifolia]
MYDCRWLADFGLHEPFFGDLRWDADETRKRTVGKLCLGEYMVSELISKQKSERAAVPEARKVEKGREQAVKRSGKSHFATGPKKLRGRMFDG